MRSSGPCIPRQEDSTSVWTGCSDQSLPSQEIRRKYRCGDKHPEQAEGLNDQATSEDQPTPPLLKTGLSSFSVWLLISPCCTFVWFFVKNAHQPLLPQSQLELDHVRSSAIGSLASVVAVIAVQCCIFKLTCSHVVHRARVIAKHHEDRWTQCKLESSDTDTKQTGTRTTR